MTDTRTLAVNCTAKLYSFRKTCAQCGTSFERPHGYSHAMWERRKFCCYPCSVSARTVGLDARLEKYTHRGAGDSCWIWTGPQTAGGYGMIDQLYAHRLMYEKHKGPIPAGLHIDHLCRNTICVNPGHLEAVTPGENIRRGVGAQVTRERRAAITHCKRGHPFAGDNLAIVDGYRLCRTCQRDRYRQWWHRRKRK